MLERRAFPLKHASAYTGLSEAYLRKMIESDNIPAHRAGIKILIFKDDLDRFLDDLPRSEGPLGSRTRQARIAQEMAKSLA